jgi:hypothetical protein
MLKRHERFTPARPQEFSRGGQGPKASKGSGFVAYTLDYHHECAWNLVGNCRGAQQLAFLDVSNRGEEFMGCKAELRSKDFVTGKPGTLTRQMLVGPKATRRLVLGDVNEQPDKGAISVTCKAIPKLAEKCRGREVPSATRGHYRRATVFTRRPREARDWRVMRSSAIGCRLAAIHRPMPRSRVRAVIPSWMQRPSTPFAADTSAMNAKYGLGSIRIAFKLQD